MTRRVKDPDLHFINENRHELFKGRNHYWGILRGKVDVPEIPVEVPDELDTAELNVLSFGQFVSYRAQILSLSMSDFAHTLQITVDDLAEIYDDIRLPWDFSVEVLRNIAETLHISMAMLARAIRNHTPSDEVLRNRLPQQTIAARTHYTLDQVTRKNDLMEAQLAMQRHKELQKKQTLVVALEKELR